MTMLKKLILENFKCFNGRWEIDLAPITLVYGPNSSGKSSLLQAIQLIANTVSAGRDGSTEPELKLAVTTSDRNLGDFQNIAYCQEKSKIVSFGYQLARQQDQQTRHSGIRPLIQALEYEKEVAFSFGINEDATDQRGAIHQLEIRYGARPDERILYRRDSVFLMPDQGGLQPFSRWLTDLQKLAISWEAPEGIHDGNLYFNPFETARGSSIARELGPHNAHFLASSFGLFAWIIATSGKPSDLLGMDLSPWTPPKPAGQTWLDHVRTLEPFSHRYFRETYEAFKATQLEPRELAAIVFSAGLPPSLFSRYTYDVDISESDTNNDIYIYPDPLSIDPQSRLITHTFSEGRLREVLKEFGSITALREMHERENQVGDTDRGSCLDQHVIRHIACSVAPFPLDLLDGYSYVEPLRDKPRRLYPYHSDGAGVTVPEYAQQLYSNRYGLGTLNNWLRRLGVDYEIQVKDVSSNILGSYWAIMAKDLHSHCRLTLCDVGFGISQLIPIIVDAVHGSPGIHLVEQPELHLHPRLQAELGSLLCEDLRNRGSVSRWPSKQWIVETHSELILLRIRKQVKHGYINPSDIKVLYVEPTIKGSRVKELRIDADGSMVDEWPAGFFEDKLLEMEGLL